MIGIGTWDIGDICVQCDAYQIEQRGKKAFAREIGTWDIGDMSIGPVVWGSVHTHRLPATVQKYLVSLHSQQYFSSQNEFNGMT